MDEALARLRRANEWEAWNADPDRSAVTLRCECGHELCGALVVATPDELDHARSLHARIVSPAHAHVAGSAVLSRESRYALVADE